MTKKLHLLPVAGLLLLGLVAYADAYRCGFVFDDLAQVRDSPLARDLGLWAPLGAGWRTDPTRAIGYLSFALNHRLWGPSPRSYHAVNVAIHLASALLVYALAVLAFRAPRVRDSWLAPHTRGVAFVAAALFVTHPIQTQAVTYVVQRLTSLAALFYLAAAVLYVAWRLAPPGQSRGREVAAYLGAIACAALAAKTKEIAVTLPAAILLLELALFDAEDRRWATLLPFVAAALLVPLGIAQRAPLVMALSGAITGSKLEQAPPHLAYVATQVPVIVAYLGLLLLPIGQSLDHDVPLQRSFLDREVLAALPVLAALAGLAAWLWWRTRRGAPAQADPAARLVAAGIAWWFVTLSVESLVPIVDVLNEHRVYLPSAGLFVAAAVSLAFLARRLAGAERAPGRLVAGGAALATLLAFATLLRNVAWRSEVTIWADAAAKAPAKLRPVVNHGTALLEAGQPGRALPVLLRAIELDPSSVHARSQLASALLALGRPAEAEPELREVLRAAPRDPEALFNLATLLWEAGRRDEARGWYGRFVEAAGQRYAGARRVAESRTSAPPAQGPGP